MQIHHIQHQNALNRKAMHVCCRANGKIAKCNCKSGGERLANAARSLARSLARALTARKIARRFPIAAAHNIDENISAPSGVVLIEKFVHHQKLSDNICKIEELCCRVHTENMLRKFVLRIVFVVFNFRSVCSPTFALNRETTLVEWRANKLCNKFAI